VSAPAFFAEAEGFRLSGTWTLAALTAGKPRAFARLRKTLREAGQRRAGWHLAGVEKLDSAAALLLWQSWGRRWPEELEATPAQREALQRAAALAEEMSAPSPVTQADATAGEDSLLKQIVLAPVLHLGRPTLILLHNLRGVVELFGRLVLDSFFLFRHPQYLPLKEFSANLCKVGAQALPVLALMGFLIGVTISYLSALQLKLYGADLFIVNILGLSIIRELGPVLAAVLVAGRSGSAMTAQIGVMRVTEEIDALATFGVSRTIRVVLPKVAALTLATPLLVLWVSAAAIVGGALAARLQLDISFLYFFSMLPRSVPIANLWIALAKGMVFGFLIALLACQLGLHVRPNTESLSRRTTASVVTAITLVILADALFAILTRDIGISG
jgi:phospholipid/cholesterol/gamma-HCH transport system permease protein